MNLYLKPSIFIPTSSLHHNGMTVMYSHNILPLFAGKEWNYNVHINDGWRFLRAVSPGRERFEPRRDQLALFGPIERGLSLRELGSAVGGVDYHEGHCLM